MEEMDYQNRITLYSNQAAEYQSKLQSISESIEEAEAALQSAQNYSDKFYASMEKKKDISSGLAQGNGLKAVTSWANMANELLSGFKFQNASQNVQNMIQAIQQKLKQLYEQYNECEAQLRNAKTCMATAQDDLRTYRIQQASLESEAQN